MVWLYIWNTIFPLLSVYGMLEPTTVLCVDQSFVVMLPRIGLFTRSRFPTPHATPGSRFRSQHCRLRHERISQIGSCCTIPVDSTEHLSLSSSTRSSSRHWNLRLHKSLHVIHRACALSSSGSTGSGLRSLALCLFERFTRDHVSGMRRSAAGLAVYCGPSSRLTTCCMVLRNRTQRCRRECMLR